MDPASRLGLKVLSHDAVKEDAALTKAMKRTEKGEMFSEKNTLNFPGE